MFKKLTFFLFFVIAFVSLEAQVQTDTLPPYKKDNHMPAFRIQKFDDSWLTRDQLPKNVPTVIIYFSPDCAHCKHEAREIVKNIDKLKNVNFVWISYKEMELIKEFFYVLDLYKYPNMYAGRDPKYMVPAFYRVKFTPFVAVYDKKGLFVKAFDGGAEMPQLLPLLK